METCSAMPNAPRMTVGRALSLLVLALLWAGVAYLWVLPFTRARELRGNYLFGYFHLQDVYVGIPLLLATLAATVALLAPKRIRKPIGFRAAALLLGLLVPTAVFDLAYSLVYQGAIKPMYWLDLQHISRQENEADPELGFRRKPLISWRGGGTETEAPYEYRTDENGFRNAPGIQKAEIVFIGDSYTEAAQVDESETFVQRVGSGAKTRVVNLGRGAYGPQQELIVLRRYGLPYEPKIVIWQLFEGNDLADAQEFAIWRENPDRVIRGLTGRYLQNSFFHPFFALTIRSKNKVAAYFDHGDGRETLRTLRYRWMPNQTLERDRGYAITTSVLEKGYALCEERGIRLIVLFIPTQVRVNGHRLRFESKADRERFYPEPTGGDLKNDFGTRLHEFCRQLGCELIDVYPTFEEQALKGTTGLYIPEDEHLDRVGHRLIADLILSRL